MATGARPPLAGWATSLAAVLYRVYHATLRVAVLWPDGALTGADEFPLGRQVFALCEQDAVAVAGLVADTDCTVLVTIGRDGDRAAALLERLGCRTVRGSSRRGGAAAFKGLLDELAASNGPAAIVVDGPLGPAGEAKSGAVACGIRTGRPVHAVAAAARHRIVLGRTWSGLYLPLPFTRVVVACDDPLPVDSCPDPDLADTRSQELTRRLRELRRRAGQAVARSHHRDGLRSHGP